MLPETLPDAIIIGDSHSNALKAGCDAAGLRTEMLRFSGNFWHSGHVIFHPQHGIWVRNLPALQADILAMRERLGGRSVISPDIPIIAAMGFHLGRIVPPFGFNNHVTHAGPFEADPTAHYASVAMVDAYLDTVRANHIRIAQRMSRHGNMVLVVPPNVFPLSNYASFSDALSRKLRAVKVQMFDPSNDLCAPGHPLAPEYLAADGVHGNDRYGAEVIDLLLKRGQITKRAA